VAQAQGQPKKKTGEIEDAEIIIEKNREITLPEAERNFEKITTPARKPEQNVQKYDYNDRAVKLTDLNPKFRILQMPQEPAKELTGGLLKAGIASYVGNYLEGYYNSTQNKDFSYGAHVKHLSFGRGPVDKSNSSTSENFLGVHGKYFGGGLTAGGALEYSREKYNFYGYKPGTDVSKDDIKQVFNTIAFKTNFTSNNVSSPLDYKLDVNLFNLTDRFNAKEFEFATNLRSKYSVSDAITAIVDADVSVTRLTDDGSIGRNLFRFHPAVKFGVDLLSINAGVNMVYQNDTSGLHKLNMFPAVTAQFNFLDNFSLFGGLEGDIQRVTLRQLVNENPYLAPEVSVFNTNKARDIYAGLKGKLGGDLTFATRLGYAGYKNMYFYVNSETDTSKFALEYEEGFTNVLNFSGELSYNASEKLRLGVKADYYSYKLKNLDAAWHKPTFTASFLGRYNFIENLFFNTEIYYLGGITAKKPFSDQKVQLDPIFDLNLKAEYLFLDKFSAFLSLNNIVSNKYQRFLNYPNRGFTVMLGATYSF
jgi:hypothetical protein